MKFVTIENGRPDLEKLPTDTPKDLKALMVKCWDQEQKNRPDFEEILEALIHI